jgi:hypothetical protein
VVVEISEVVTVLVVVTVSEVLLPLKMNVRSLSTLAMMALEQTHSRRRIRRRPPRKMKPGRNVKLGKIPLDRKAVVRAALPIVIAVRVESHGGTTPRIVRICSAA